MIMRYHETATTVESRNDRSKPLGLVWINCPYPVVAAGLERALESRAKVHLGSSPPLEEPSSAIYDTGGVEGLSEGVRRFQEVNPDISILIFSLHIDLPLARVALQVGARGFIHASMEPEQIVRAVEVAAQGELVAPRKLLEYLIANEMPADLDSLTSRQRDTLDLVAEGLSNAQIAKRFYLSESTVKQHLRSAYKVLGVSNRNEATRLLRNNS
jgi:DNA-binding NarL/FixJ family response regulator